MDADPVLSETITLQVGNSLGSSTFGFLFVGSANAQIPTSWHGDLLVVPIALIPLPIPTAGLNLPLAIPCDDSLCGISGFLQVLEADAGASKGVSFTPGLELVLGR